MPRTVLLLLLLLGAPALARTEIWRGQVVGVADGDTITVLHEGRPQKIRLQGIDAPEKDQPFGTRAKQLTSSLAFGKEVTVKVVTRDRYGRSVGWVYLPVGACLNEELLRAGLAWHYKKYDQSKRLAELEAQARAGQRGLWADGSSRPPWQFREQQRNPPAAGPVASRPSRGGFQIVGPLHGNTRSKVVHRPTCKEYSCKHCTRSFNTVEQAKAAGYRPCGTCFPAPPSKRQPPH